MNLHEYQAKQVLREYGIATPRGVAIESASQAEGAIAELGGDAWVVKAQIHAGGRGKAGGVKLVRSREALLEAVECAARQAAGDLPECPRRADGVAPADRGNAADRARALPQPDGGPRIRAHRAGRLRQRRHGHRGRSPDATPEKILTEVCDPLWGLQDFQCRALAFGLGLEGTQIGEFGKLAKGLYQLFMESDLAMVEINPLVVTATGELVALDCKIERRRQRPVPPEETGGDARSDARSTRRKWRRKEFDLNYIALDGNIGCMVNGAGLAMATMDLIKLHGGQPANFLDVGGGATAETVAKAFKIILSDANVKAILVNIFGGIVRCDIIAEGIITAVKEVGVKVPVIVRLEGTNVELGQKMLAESGVGVISASDLTDAAKRAVAAVQ